MIPASFSAGLVVSNAEDGKVTDRIRLMRIGYQERRKSLETKISSLIHIGGKEAEAEGTTIRDHAYHAMRKIHQRDGQSNVVERLYVDAKHRKVTQEILQVEEKQRLLKASIPCVNSSSDVKLERKEGPEGKASVYERLFHQADERRRRFAAKARAHRDARICLDQQADDMNREAVEALQKHTEKGAAMVRTRSPLFYAGYHEKRHAQLEKRKLESETDDCTFAPVINPYSAKIAERRRITNEPLYERLHRLGTREKSFGKVRPRFCSANMTSRKAPDPRLFRERNLSAPPSGSDTKPLSAYTVDDPNSKSLDGDDEEDLSATKSDVEEMSIQVAKEEVGEAHDRKVYVRQHAFFSSETESEDSEVVSLLTTDERAAEKNGLEDEVLIGSPDQQPGSPQIVASFGTGATDHSTSSVVGKKKRLVIQAWKHGTMGMPHKAELTLESTALFWTSKDGRLNYITWDEVLMAMPALVRPRTARRSLGSFSQILKFPRLGANAHKEAESYISIVCKRDRKPLVLSFEKETARDDALDAIDSFLGESHERPGLTYQQRNSVAAEPIAPTANK